jgi:hypothetical protein
MTSGFASGGGGMAGSPRDSSIDGIDNPSDAACCDVATSAADVASVCRSVDGDDGDGGRVDNRRIECDEEEGGHSEDADVKEEDVTNRHAVSTAEAAMGCERCRSGRCELHTPTAAARWVDMVHCRPSNACVEVGPVLSCGRM